MTNVGNLQSRSQEMPKQASKHPSESRPRSGNKLLFMHVFLVLVMQSKLCMWQPAMCAEWYNVIRCGGEEPLPEVSVTPHTVHERPSFN